MTNLLVRTLLLSVFVVCLTSLDASAQSRKRLRELDKKEQAREKEEQRANEEAKKRHMDIQKRNTRKEMKRLRKKSDRLNNNKRAPFWQRSKRLKKKRR